MRELLTAINEKLNIPVHEDDICKIYRMKGKGTDNTGPVKVSLYDYKLKMNIYHARSLLKGAQIFINEDYENENYLPKDIRVQNGEKRKAREQHSKKRLAQQSSEENDSMEAKITQEFKKLRDMKTISRRQPETHLLEEAVISNTQKK